MRSRDVLHCIATLEGGGAERQLSYISGGLSSLGWRVHVALLKGGPNKKKLLNSGSVLHYIPYRGHYNPSILWSLYLLIKKLKPALVQVWLPMMTIVGGFVCSLMKIPWVYSERSAGDSYERSIIHSSISSVIARKSSAIISNSLGGDLFWRSKVGGKVPRFLIPNALPLNEIERVKPLESMDELCGYNERIILYVGSLNPWKNIKNLMISLQYLAKEENIRAFFCGDGLLREWVKAFIRHHGLESSVFLMGFREDVWAWMKRADVFVSVSLYEGMPNTVMEAMACSCPLVLSDIPAHRSILNEESAFFVPHDNPLKIAEGIRQVLYNPLEAKKKAQHAKAKVSQYSIEKMAFEYHKVYQKVLGTCIDSRK